MQNWRALWRTRFSDLVRFWGTLMWLWLLLLIVWTMSLSDLAKGVLLVCVIAFLGGVGAVVKEWRADTLQALQLAEDHERRRKNLHRWLAEVRAASSVNQPTMSMPSTTATKGVQTTVPESDAGVTTRPTTQRRPPRRYSPSG